MNTQTCSISRFNELVSAWIPQVTEHMDTHAAGFVSSAILKLGNLKYCSRCGGYGFLRGYEYIQNGVCFKCNGACVRDAGSSYEFLKKTFETNPSILYTQIAKEIKKAEKALARQNAKWAAAEVKLAKDQTTCISILSPEDAEVFSTFVSNMKSKLDESNAFLADVYFKWTSKGTLSEKQMLAVVNAIRKNQEREELRKNAISLIAGEKYEHIPAKVLKIEQVTVQKGPWSMGLTNKIVLGGDHDERYVVKTDNAKLMEVFTKALENGVVVDLSGTCKWVAPNGFPAVFTARGMKVTA